MKRLERLQAILIQLQSKKIVRATDLAEKFDVSLRTIYRDIRSLESGGVPIGAEAGIGYFLIDGFHLPPVMFTREEAGAILMAGKLLEKQVDKFLQNHFENALSKVKAVLDSEKKEELNQLEDKISIDPFGWQIRDQTTNIQLSKIQSVLPHKRLIKIRYHASYSGQMTERTVEPIGLCYYGSQWHLIAYCQLRGDYRDFRVDRIEKLDIVEGNFSKQDHISLQKYLDKLNDTTDVNLVVVRFDKNVYKYLQDVKYQFGWVSEQILEKEVEMTFSAFSIDYFARWLLMWGETVTIVSPDELTAKIKDLTIELSKHYTP